MPSLEWEENIFLGLKSLYNSVLVSPKERSIRLKQFELKDIKSVLLLVANAISGKHVNILETDDPILYVNDRICLPKRIYLTDDSNLNRECYLLRTIASAIAIRNKLFSDDSDLPSLIQYCNKSLPYFSTRFDILQNQLESVEHLIPRLPFRNECSSIENNSQNSDFTEAEQESQNAKITEIEGDGRTNVVEVKESETGEQDMPFHTFEKAETLDEYNGLSRQNDAEDELGDHSEALSKLKMESVMRSQDRSESVYRADIMLDSAGFEFTPPPVTSGIPYPEWDYKKKKFKKNWCYLQELPSDRTDEEWVHKTSKKYASLILTLKKKFAQVSTELLKKKRQAIGDEIDLDAVIDLLVRMKTKDAPPDYLYLGVNRTFPDIATIILIDSSYSTDSWIENRCVMDIMKETVFCISEVLSDADQQIGIYGFSSNTRQSCNFRSIKTFDEVWNRTRARLGCLDSVGYTRIGPALRHSYSLLAKTKAEKKLLILLTDGKPCDYDRYEGRYGIEDVRKAILEGKAEGILTHAFAVDKQARDYFPIMFTKSNFDIVAHPSKLISTLFELFLKLKSH